MKVFKESKGYFRKIFTFLLMFIVIPLSVVSIVFFVFFSRQIRETYYESQANLVHALVTEAENTIRTAAKSIPQDSVIAFFDNQFTGGSGIMTVKVYEASDITDEEINELKNNLPSDQLLINGTFLDDTAGYYVILKLNSKELGMDSYLFMLVFITTITAVALAIVAYFISKKIAQPVQTLYKSAIVTREQDFSDVAAAEGNEKDEVGTIAAVFEEMNHDLRNTKELINTYKSAARSYSFCLFLEKNIPHSRFLDDNENFKDCNSFLICGIKICNEVVASHYLLNLSRLISGFLSDDSTSLVSPINQDSLLVLLGSKEKNETFERLLKDLYDMIDPLAKSKYIMAVTAVTSDLTALPRRNKQLSELIKNGEFYEVYNKLISRETIVKLSGKNLQLLINEYYPRFASSLLDNNRLGIEMTADRFFNKLEYVEMESSIETIQKLLTRLSDEPTLSERIDSEIIEQIKQMRTFKEIKKSLIDIMIKAASSFEQEINPEKKLCENVAAMLIANYSKDIDMLSIASNFSVSYSYLSRIFKNNMLMTLTDYLNKYRIDRSCELLSEKSEKLESIATKVGYNNIQSFQRFFKKYKGTTPTLYRKSVLQN
ncbi:MAG: AraC family transcriptional regulator [Lachnospiraceae bacterium]|nr:AraC family transcriptional regulator [Lachnospiraceae bacterium]